MNLTWDVLVKLPAESEAGAVRTLLPEVDWSDPVWGRFAGPGFTLEFGLEAEGRIDSFLIHVRGGGDPVAEIMNLCRPAGWSVMDGTTCEWLDPDHPSREGWIAWQQYRVRLLESARPPLSTGVRLA